MPGEIQELGPFTGGLVTRVADPTTLQPEDLQQAENFVFDVYGNLVSRPPILEVEDAPAPTDGANNPWEVILTGFFSVAAEPENVPFMLIGNKTDGLYIKYASDPWKQIATAYRSTAVLGSKGNEQVIWIATLNTAGGGYWKPGDNTMTLVNNVPGANKLLWYKERLFFLNTGNNEAASRIAWSDIKPEDSSDFPSTNELFVNINDGQAIQDGIVFLDNIYVFKYRSTYIVTYDTSISRIQVRPVSNTVGVKARNCIQIYADQLFVYHERFVWRFTGSTFVPLSQKIIIPPETDANPTLSQWTDTLVLRFGDECYVYSFYTDSWTTWKSNRMFNWIEQGAETTGFTTIEYYGGDRATGKLVHIDSVWPSQTIVPPTLNEFTSEEFTCILRTKQFEFDQGASYKRMFWWGVAILFYHAYQAGDTAEDRVVSAGFRAVDENGSPIIWQDFKIEDVYSTNVYSQILKVKRAFRFRAAEFYVRFNVHGLNPNAVKNLIVSIKTAQTARGRNESQSVDAGGPIGPGPVSVMRAL